jgi:hypothetical protein
MFDKQESKHSLQRKTQMIKKYVAMGLGALIAVAPVAAMAKTSTKTHTASHKTHKTHMASKSKHTAKKMAPEAPKS